MDPWRSEVNKDPIFLSPSYRIMAACMAAVGVADYHPPTTLYGPLRMQTLRRGTNMENSCGGACTVRTNLLTRFSGSSRPSRGHQ